MDVNSALQSEMMASVNETSLLTWVEFGAIRALDFAFARFVNNELEQGLTPLQWLATVLVSERTAHGHVCVDLAEFLRQPDMLLNNVREPMAKQEILAAVKAIIGDISLAEWRDALIACEAIEFIARDGTSQSSSPMVLSEQNNTLILYLRRYWQYERTIKLEVSERLRNSTDFTMEHTKLLIDTLFQAQSSPLTPDWQKIACALSARKRFSIITGGPGTGKTTTVLKLLALLQGQCLAAQRPFLTIRLAAPTGKAAARLNESITADIDRLNLVSALFNVDQQRQWRDAVPTQVTTLHRLLGSKPNSRKFVHDKGNPLNADVVVVDEASMVDVEMMASLLRALRPQTRLILLGDKNQLASVEAGSVLGDLCAKAHNGGYSEQTRAYVADTTGENIPLALVAKHLIDAGNDASFLTSIAQATTMLRHCYRAEGKGILSFAEWVNSQAIFRDGMAALHDFFSEYAELSYVTVASETSQPDWSAFNNLVVTGYQGYLHMFSSLAQQTPATIDNWVEAVFKEHKKFQLLCGLRQGDFGIGALNQRIEQQLIQHQLIHPKQPNTVQTDAYQQVWYSGRPILVTKNDYALNLMNGDIGICVKLPWETREKVVFMQGTDVTGKPLIKWVLPSRLQQVETVFAMTVHKSQGSEFAHTALILPDTDSAVLTKELLYTAITRSKHHFSLVIANEAVLTRCLKNKIRRQSGLAE